MALDSLSSSLTDGWMQSNTEFVFLMGGDHESRLKVLRTRWDESVNVIMAEMGANTASPLVSIPKVCEDWFQRIVQWHSNIERHYHTLCHLEEMFAYIDILLENHQDNEEEKDGTDEEMRTSKNEYKAVIYLSVFFHDAVYNPKSSTNEEDSAKLFWDFIGDLVHNAASVSPRQSVTSWYGLDRVEKFILATKSHNPNQTDIPQNEKFYLHIFLDADMSVLGKSLEAYLYYASLIRREYEHVPRHVYCQKRAEILRAFIGSSTEQSKGIFYDKRMKYALEARAMRNLLCEIELLDKGQIPGEDDITSMS